MNKLSWQGLLNRFDDREKTHHHRESFVIRSKFILRLYNTNVDKGQEKTSSNIHRKKI